MIPTNLDNLNLTVPDCPTDLWRRMLASITVSPKQFEMSSWHGVLFRDPESGDYEHDELDSLESARAEADERRAQDIACHTTHCMAGWAEVLVPGMTQLVNQLNVLQAESEANWDALVGTLNCTWTSASMSPIPVAAALVIQKLWPAFNTNIFYHSNNEDGLEYIRCKAQDEEDRFGPIKAVQVEIPSIHTLPTYEGIDDPDEP